MRSKTVVQIPMREIVVVPISEAKEFLDEL